MSLISNVAAQLYYTWKDPSTVTGFMKISVLFFFSKLFSGTSALPNDCSPQHKCTCNFNAREVVVTVIGSSLLFENALAQS